MHHLEHKTDAFICLILTAFDTSDVQIAVSWQNLSISVAKIHDN